MSLLNKASLIQIPSGYKDGTLYSAKPTNGDGDFTFSRGSNLAATRVNSDGLIEKGRENLLLQSNQFDTTWSAILGASVASGETGYDGSSNAWTFTKASGQSSRIYQNITLSPIVHTTSIYAKAGTLRYLAILEFSGSFIYFDLQNGTQGTTSGSPIDVNIEAVGTTGWYRCSITEDSVITQLRIYASDTDGSISGAGTILIQSAQTENSLVATDYIETGATTAQAGILEDMPRLDYSGGATCGHLILEPQRSNLVTNSEYYSASSWQNVGATITNNNTTSPEGKQNATLLVGTSGSASRVQDFFGALSGAHTYSLFIKSTGVATRLNLQTNDVGGATFSVPASGTPTVYAEGTNIGDPFIEDYGSGWYRVGFSFTPTGGGVNNYFQIYPDSSGNISSIYVYGAQCEAGSYPTSYIPTYGSSVTRSKDSCTDAGNASTFNDSEGVLYAEISSLIDDNDGSKSISISSGAYSNNIILQYTTNTNQIVFKTSPSYTTPIFESFIVSDITQNSKIAFKYKLNDCSFWHNGVKLGSITSFTPFSSGTLTELNFNRGDGNEGFEGKVKMVATFTEALTDDELAALTTI